MKADGDCKASKRFLLAPPLSVVPVVAVFLGSDLTKLLQWPLSVRFDII